MKTIRKVHMEMVKDSTVKYGDFDIEDANRVGCLSDALDIFRSMRVAQQPIEHVYIIGFNNKMVPIIVSEMSGGNVNSSVFSVPHIFQLLLSANAVTFMVAHNHPSGNPYPSEADCTMTKRLAVAGKMIGVSLVDHIVIGDDEHYSFAGEQPQLLNPTENLNEFFC